MHKIMKEADAVELFEELSNFQEGEILKLEPDRLADRIYDGLSTLGYCPPPSKDLYKYLEDLRYFEDIDYFECFHSYNEEYKMTEYIKVSDTHALEVSSKGVVGVDEDDFMEFTDDAQVHSF